MDVMSLAVRAALHNTRIPRLIVTGEGEEVEVEVSDNPHDSTSLNITRAPVIITVTQVCVCSLTICHRLIFCAKIGLNFVVDVNMKEEMCASSRLSLAINEQGQILSVNKDIGGGIPCFKLHDAVRVSHWSSA